MMQPKKGRYMNFSLSFLVKTLKPFSFLKIGQQTSTIFDQRLRSKPIRRIELLKVSLKHSKRRDKWCFVLNPYTSITYINAANPIRPDCIVQNNWMFDNNIQNHRHDDGDPDKKCLQSTILSTNSSSAFQSSAGKDEPCRTGPWNSACG